MRIVVYGICRDEARHVERFMRSTAGADAVVICDTGSTDGTQAILRAHGAIVHDIDVSPWRFDLARNMALTYVPPDADVAISMDLDEVLVDGWREIIEANWRPGTTMLRYPFVHNWEDAAQTVPRLSVWGFKVHCPRTYLWRYPIHETLELREGASESIVVLNKELIHHRPDPQKAERWSRIGLLESAAKEYPDDQRMAHLYGRELWFHGRHQEAIVELKRHLSITHPYADPPEDLAGIGQTRSTSCRLIGRSLMALSGRPDDVMVWLLRAVAESPSQREPWMWLAYGWLLVGDCDSALAAANRGLAITDRLRSVEIEERCWDRRALELLRDIRRAKRGDKRGQ